MDMHDMPPGMKKGAMLGMGFQNPPEKGLDPNESGRTTLIASGASMFAIGFTAVILRFIARLCLRLKLGLDDWLILGSMTFAGLTDLISIISAEHLNFGQHIAKSNAKSLEMFLKANYVFDLFYVLSLGLSKLSMLALYWRIFHVKPFRKPVLITAAITVAWITSTALVSLFPCVPVDGFWDMRVEAKCISQGAFFISQGLGNISLDIVLIALPLTMISRLQMSRAQKLGVGSVFFLGAAVTISSVIRMWQLLATQIFMKGYDPTYSRATIAMWSNIETGLSVLAACLPPMRPLLRLVISGSIHPKRNMTLESSLNRSSSTSQARDLTLSENPGSDDEKAKPKSKQMWPLNRMFATQKSPMNQSSMVNDAHASPSPKSAWPFAEEKSQPKWKQTWPMNRIFAQNPGPTGQSDRVMQQDGELPLVRRSFEIRTYVRVRKDQVKEPQVTEQALSDRTESTAPSPPPKDIEARTPD